MQSWDLYKARMNAHGENKRETLKKREQRYLRDNLRDSLSYQQLTIDGAVRQMAVINSDNLNMKTLCSLPGEDIRQGSLVEWMDNKWLVTEKDAATELYAKAKMVQCNYPLRWIADDGNVVERWSIVEDGTKYLTGEYGDKYFVVTRGDSRISVTVSRDEYTVKLNRENRFLIDDFDSPSVLAYRLTKPFKLGGSYSGNGVLHFVMQECNTEDSDNPDLHIANYYKHFPREGDEKDSEKDGESSERKPFVDENGKKVWL